MNDNNTDVTDVNLLYPHPELVLGICAPVGTNSNRVVDAMKQRLEQHFGYTVEEIRVSSAVIRTYASVEEIPGWKEYERINAYMDAGNHLRLRTRSDGIMAYGVIRKIFSKRDPKNLYRRKTAYIVNSLKHPKEVEALRNVYAGGFYLFGIASQESTRKKFLMEERNVPEAEAEKLIARDRWEDEDYGQQTSKAFHLSDFFIPQESERDLLNQAIWRSFDLLFGNPYTTPSFDEYAMFMAFTASLRSADLSRQVGAVITRDNEILSSGANDCPKYGGGLYWPVFNEAEKKYVDHVGGRDYTLGKDKNKEAQQEIIDNILAQIKTGCDKLNTKNGIECLSQQCLENIRSALKNSEIQDLTEFGRVVHAEMEAMLFCARNNISCRGATLYCTTFPCHNCAKHLIAAGIEKVIYVEPYPKSRALQYYQEEICESSFYNTEKSDKVAFVPFVGVGPRKFFDLFSTKLSSGYVVKRKDSDGKIADWTKENASPRLNMTPIDYFQKEAIAVDIFSRIIEQFEKENFNDKAE
ncbi:MAG: dCMP deaminase family protein [Deltaproteobacteria bacterium]|nr:dCMP deaminase family protein [Deltaproteobacteria bacterium]